jgi:peptidyl-prolyl cis-trans isomerase B (cyclophilin B)
MIQRMIVFCCLLLLTGAAAYAQPKKPVAKKPVSKLKKPVKPVAKPAPKPVPKVLMDPAFAGNTRVVVETEFGNMVIRLYDSTPLHRDNFVKLVEQHFYDSLLFHRVIQSFMVQGGDPTSKNAPPGIMLGGGGEELGRIRAEFHPRLFHKRGVLAAARDDNPEKASSACQFYIVQGRRFNDAELDMVEMRTSIKIPPDHRVVYKNMGGAPHLDMNYTVFGEIEKGMEVIDKIAAGPADGNNRPLSDIRFTIRLLKPGQESK